MGFDVGFVNDIDSVFVAELVPQRVVGIMGRADGIDVMLLHETKILLHRLSTDRMASHGVVFMAIHTFDQNRLSVKEKLPVLDFDLPKPDANAFSFDDLPLLILEYENERVEIWLFG